MIISAIIAGIIIISLSSSISEIQSQQYEESKLPENINQLRDEAERITSDGAITAKEKRNFRKMTNYIDNYEIKTTFDDVQNCVNIEMKGFEREVSTPCMN